MKQNQILLFGAIGVGAYLLLSGKFDGLGDTPPPPPGGGGSGGQMFTLPDGRKVPVSQLPSLGYVQYQGQWYHQSQLTVPNMPSGTDPNSPQWLNIINIALQTGAQLYNLSGELASQISKSIKSTAVNWNMSSVTIVVKYGYQTYNGTVNPTTNENKTYSNQQITISGNGQQTKIKLIKAGVVQKEATIDFFNEKLVGFDAGSVGISGIYIGSYNNTDTVTSMYGVYGIGALKGKGSRAKNEYNRMVDAYKYFIYNINEGRITEGYEYKSDAMDVVSHYNNAKVVTLRQIKEMGIADPRENFKYIEGIGSIYKYNNPKGITYCNDKTYSDAAKGACSYHGGAAEVKLIRNLRDYSGKGKYSNYGSYRKSYKNNWAKMNKSDKVVTL